MKKLLLLSVVGCCCLTSYNVCFADDIQDIRDGVRDLKRDIEAIRTEMAGLRDLTTNLSQARIDALTDGIKTLNTNLSQSHVDSLIETIKSLRTDLSQARIDALTDGIKTLNTNLSQAHVDNLGTSILEIKNKLNALDYASPKIEQINASQVSPANVTAAAPAPMTVYVPTVPQPTMAAYTHAKTPSIFGTVGDIFTTLWGSNRY